MPDILSLGDIELTELQAEGLDLAVADANASLPEGSEPVTRTSYMLARNQAVLDSYGQRARDVRDARRAALRDKFGPVLDRIVAAPEGVADALATQVGDLLDKAGI